MRASAFLKRTQGEVEGVHMHELPLSREHGAVGERVRIHAEVAKESERVCFKHKSSKSTRARWVSAPAVLKRTWAWWKACGGWWRGRWGAATGRFA